MNPIPNPILKKLVLTLLVGTGCFIVGLVFFLSRHDHIFFLLSCVIFLLSMGKGISLFQLARKQSYTQLEGLCISVQFKLFTNSYQILLVDAENTEHTLLIGKNHKLHAGLSYRFYFKTATSISPGQNPLLEKVFTNQLLGVEIITR